MVPNRVQPLDLLELVHRRLEIAAREGGIALRVRTCYGVHIG